MVADRSPSWRCCASSVRHKEGQGLDMGDRKRTSNKLAFERFENIAPVDEDALVSTLPSICKCWGVNANQV